MKDHLKEVEQAFREDHPELKGSLEELIALTSAADDLSPADALRYIADHMPA